MCVLALAYNKIVLIFEFLVIGIHADLFLYFILYKRMVLAVWDK